MTDSKPTVQKLRHDERGAIMVIAVFMSAFLVGGLWYMAGIGNAALFKEGMQSGADAGAFAGAVFHARGMNIIALINIIMCAILAVLVALKIAYLLIMITAVILDVICAIPFCEWACPLAELAHNAASELDNFTTNTVEPLVDKALRILSKTEVAVATAIPAVAVIKSNEMAQKYTLPVKGGVMISESINPGNGKIGLPVTEDKYSVLCEKAGGAVADFALMPFSKIGLPTKWISGLVSGLVKMAPSYFCGDCEDSSSSSSNNSTDKNQQKADTASTLAKKKCDAQKEAIDDYNKNNKKNKQSFDYDKCMKDQTKASAKDVNKTFSTSSNTGSSCGKTPKKVIDDAKNGNKYFQVMTFAWGGTKVAMMGSRQVKVAAWGKQASGLPSFIQPSIWGKIQIGQAEFYYDRAGDWGKLKDEAMWNMRWRARLRHYHKDNAPASTLVGLALDILGMEGEVGNLIDGVNNLTNSLPSGGLSGSDSGSLADIYRKQASGSQSSGFDKVDASKAFGTELKH